MLQLEQLIIIDCLKLFSRPVEKIVLNTLCKIALFFLLLGLLK